MPNRDDILESFKDTLENISVGNNFHTDVRSVDRKFMYFDNAGTAIPLLMVLGGNETFEDVFDKYAVSRLQVKILGYTKDDKEPEKIQCYLIEDVLKCLDSDTYNPLKSKMRVLGVETDEGVLHEEGGGLAMFVINLEILYKFHRSIP